MKKYLLLLAALAIMVCPSAIFATTLTTTASSTTFTATLTPSGGVQAWETFVKKVADNTSDTQITWAAFASQSPGYKVAQQYVVVSATMTNMISWRMNIYTDNLVAKTGFHPYYTKSDVAFINQAAFVSTGSVLSYGLVGQGSPTSSTATANGTTYGLPLAWMVLGLSSAIPVTPVFSNDRGASAGHSNGFTNFMWKFVQDKGRATGSPTSHGAIGSAWDPAAAYVRVWDQTGFYWNENPALAGPPPAGKVYIYLAVDSTNSKAQNYLTKSLTLDALQL